MGATLSHFPELSSPGLRFGPWTRRETKDQRESLENQSFIYLKNDKVRVLSPARNYLNALKKITGSTESSSL